MPELDPNDVAAKMAVESLDRAARLFSEHISSARKAISTKLGAGFRKHKIASSTRYGTVRTLLHRDRPIPLQDLYVETLLSNEDQTFNDDDFIRIITEPSRILIEGTAGGGKSILLRYVNLAMCHAKTDAIPLFVELKGINTNSDKNLVDILLLAANSTLPDLTEDSLRDLMNERRIILLLDGFDEINYDQREKYAIQFSELCKELPTSSIIITSRPDDLIESVEGIRTFRVQPFTKPQATALLNKLPYDSVVKEKFIQEVDAHLYDEHSDFLSNPLLVTMMLMTYHQFAEIPSKIHIFYQQAFETLFSWHDSSKDVFKRKSYTSLPIDEFQRIFSYFCAQSYSTETFMFSESYARTLLDASIKAEHVNTNSGQFLKDLLISTCLLQRDGLAIAFVHRSFQEYFTASFIARLQPQEARNALNRMLKRSSLDLVIPMSFEMNPSLIESAWALPTLNSIARKLETINTDDTIGILKIFFQELTLKEERPWITYAVPGLWANRLRALHKIYGAGMPLLNKESARAGYTKLTSDMMSNPDLRDRILRSAPYASIFFNQHKRIPKELGLSFQNLDPVILDYVDIRPWAKHTLEWVAKLRKDVKERVGERKASLRAMF